MSATSTQPRGGSRAEANYLVSSPLWGEASPQPGPERRATFLDSTSFGRSDDWGLSWVKRVPRCAGTQRAARRAVLLYPRVRVKPRAGTFSEGAGGEAAAEVAWDASLGLPLFWTVGVHPHAAQAAASPDPQSSLGRPGHCSRLAPACPSRVPQTRAALQSLSSLIQRVLTSKQQWLILIRGSLCQ